MFRPGPAALAAALLVAGVVAGPLLTPPGRAAGVQAAGAVTLAQPDDGATLDTLGPTLAWSLPAAATQYHLQVVPINNDGPGIDWHAGDAATSFAVPAPPKWFGLLPDMTYTWRVRASDASFFVALDDGSWGPWASRTFRTPPVSSDSIGRISPSEGAQVAILTPTVRWGNTRSDVFYYEVQLSTDPTFNTDPATATAMVYWELRHGGVTVPTNSYMVPQEFPLQVGEQYHWRVRPRIQGDGTPLEWSRTFSFRTPSTPPPATATPTPTRTPIPTSTPSATRTPVPTRTPTVTRTPTLTPTGTPPTATPTGTVGTATPTSIATPTGTPTPTPAALGQVLVNGSFESSGGWISDCNCVSSASVSGGWHSGSKGGYVVPLDGQGAANLYQIITLPSNASSITFSFYYQLQGTDSNADDCFVAGVLEGSTVLTSRQRCVAQGYQQSWASDSFNLTAHKGKTVIILFGMTTQSQNNHKNYALVDDASVLAQ